MSFFSYVFAPFSVLVSENIAHHLFQGFVVEVLANAK
jgi:hypothetical protein